MPDDESPQEQVAETSHDEPDSTPALSAILFVPDSYESVQRTMSHLQAQTVADQIEIVLVTPSRQQLELDESELSCFHSWQIIEVKDNKHFSTGYSAGMRQAHAPIVALTEDHAFPDANWAEVLIAAHQQSWAAVGPSMRNGNPETILSQADFCHAYSEWTYPVSSGPVRHLPGHNSSYKRDIILRFGNELDLLMEAESVLHRHLTAEGHRLTLESGTCTTHLNFTSWSAWIPLRYHIGRQFAAIWAHSWSWPRRLLFTVASPLIPWIRLWRIQKNVRRVQPCNFLITVLPVVFLGLLIELCGQMLGFAFGPADSSEKVAKYEYRRFR